MPWKDGNPPFYHSWRSMLSRCYRETDPQYKDYGGRGITVCERWKTNYKQFEKDMWPRPSLQHSIDRKDNNLGYSPENCKWSTKKEQQRNKRNTRYVTIEGKRWMVAELRDLCNLKWDTIVDRANKGLTLKEVLDPKKRHNLDGLKFGGRASGAKKRMATHCNFGHEFTPGNTRITKEGYRSCLTCHEYCRLKRKGRIL